MDSAPQAVVRKASGIGGNQMRHLGLAGQLEAVHRLLYQPVGIGDTLVLAQMLHPRFDEEGLDKATLTGSVYEHTPSIVAVAPPLVLEFRNRLQEGVAVLWADAVFDRHQ